MKKASLVLVGNGMAGIRTLEELFKIAPDDYQVTVFGAEPHPNYNRILLSPVLSGEQQFEDIILNPPSWYEAHDICLHLGDPVTEIDRLRRRVTTAAGTRVNYDRLLLATGSEPILLPVSGADLDGVVGYRSIADTRTMIEVARRGGHAVVIGGGLLGLEAAYGLRQRGMDVTVVHLGPWLLERQLDAYAGALLRESLEDRQIRFRLGAKTTALQDTGGGQVGAVVLEDGEVLPADLVVMAVGIRPQTSLAASAGLACDRGILVNDTMQTFDPRIYAVGECASHRGTAYGLVAPLFEQARVCANHLAMLGYARYTGSITSTKLKVTGVDLFSAGDFIGDEDSETITLSDPAGGLYKKLVVRDGKLVGACAFGDTADGSRFLRLIRECKDISQMRRALLLAEPGMTEAGTGEGKNLSLPDETEICGCNGITKGAIVKAIKSQGLFSVDEVKKHTKAGSSCGSCLGLVEQILVSTVSGAADVRSAADRPLCSCTDLSHAQIRKAIREHHLTSVLSAMAFMAWRTPDGCTSCRPALNYYLISTWPGEARDDARSRLVNERMHANIQKDGTYSVVPRMRGGVTSADELRRIADVADKYQVPLVKITGGQRIDLLGIRKEDLPGVWRDLGMQSGHAYGKSIRTVKTCVGNRYCRFGTQDAMEMGIRLENLLLNMWSPHKVKLAVSGCPRNCAESGIKDVGIIGVDSGWEIQVGGNGGMRTQAGQLLAKVTTGEEVVEYSLAFLQLYREEGFYLERTMHYIERVGMAHIQQILVDDPDARRALAARLRFALSLEADPWQERTESPALSRDFHPIQVRNLETV